MTSPILKLEDSRRLTGPNLFGPKPGAVIDVSIQNTEADMIISVWQKHIRTLLNRLNWQTESVYWRKFQNGASLVITAPIDCLYSATEVNEAAWQLTENQFSVQYDNRPMNLDEITKSLLAEILKEQNPSLQDIYQAAIKHKVVFLSDDDQISLGYGKSCQIFPVDKIPDESEINWGSIQDIPVAIVTGTNGKSTCVRLASSVVRAAGKCCGITSTDYIRVGEKTLDTGDYSGPGGARMLLRHPETEVAFLEVARGGMLRRGIGINQARTALITNVSEDHLGEYGINSLSDMIETKFIVRQVINESQTLVLNANDPGCVKFALTLNNTITWFSLKKENPVVKTHIEKGGNACYVSGDNICLNIDGKEEFIVEINKVPITLNGAAQHNIQNTLAVAALTYALDVAVPDIRLGLESFSSSPEDNPGRGNLFEIDNFKVILDFAHNEQGLSQMAQTLRNMPAKRRLVMLGQAGDRSENLIEGLVKSALIANPEVLIICELPDHLRGKSIGETPRLIEKYAIKHGLRKEQIVHAENTIEGTKSALDWAQTGDVMLLLGLENRDEIIAMLKSGGQSNLNKQKQI